jgi:hypothetical protein
MPEVQPGLLLVYSFLAVTIRTYDRPHPHSRNFGEACKLVRGAFQLRSTESRGNPSWISPRTWTFTPIAADQFSLLNKLLKPR